MNPDKGRELNRWLAVATCLSLAVLTYSAFLFGPADKRWFVVGEAPAVVVLYLLVNRFVLRRRAAPAFIQPDAPATLLMAAFLPLIGVGCAIWAGMWPGHDFSVAVVVVGVLAGMTVESALRRDS